LTISLLPALTRLLRVQAHPRVIEFVDELEPTSAVVAGSHEPASRLHDEDEDEWEADWVARAYQQPPQ
jgi:hypothetical protein